MSGKANNPTGGDNLEQRLRDQADAWVGQPNGDSDHSRMYAASLAKELESADASVDSDPHAGRFSVGSSTLRNSSVSVRGWALAACLLLLVGGLVYQQVAWPGDGAKPNENIARGMQRGESDGQSVPGPAARDVQPAVHPLLATSGAVRDITSSVASGAQSALLGNASVLELGTAGEQLLAMQFGADSSLSLAALAREPGRRYGSAAVWLDGRMDAFGDQTYNAAAWLVKQNRVAD